MTEIKSFFNFWQQLAEHGVTAATRKLLEELREAKELKVDVIATVNAILLPEGYKLTKLS